MSEEAAQTTDEAFDATDEEVSAAVDALVESVKAEGVAPVAEKAPRKKTTRRKSDEAVDTLVKTVNTLAETVTTLSGTIEALGAAKAAEPAAQLVLEEPEVAEVAEPEEQPEPEPEELVSEDSPSLIRFVTEWACAIVPIVAAGVIGWAAMRSKVDFVVIASVLCCLATLYAVAFVKCRERFSFTFIAGEMLVGVGAGCIVGAVAFFSQHPHRASLIVPVAVVLTVAGAVLRRPRLVSKEHLIWLAGGGVWVCMGLYLALHALAPQPETKETLPTDSHGVVATHDAGAESHDAPAAGDSHATSEAKTADAHAATESHEATPTTVAPSGEHDAHATESHESASAAPGSKNVGVGLSKADAAHISEAVAAAAAAAGHA